MVLVHGFLGFLNDQHIFLRSYWSNSFSVLGNTLFNLSLDEDEKVYEADVGGASSTHDRACELYQQIVGMDKIEKYAKINNCTIAEQVYGVEQVRQNHRWSYYKTRYLRSVSSDLSKTTAHPKGVQDWSETNKFF